MVEEGFSCFLVQVVSSSSLSFLSLCFFSVSVFLFLFLFCFFFLLGVGCGCFGDLCFCVQQFSNRAYICGFLVVLGVKIS